MLGHAAALLKFSKCVGAIGAAAYRTLDCDDFKENAMKEALLKARVEIGRRLKYS